MTMEETARIYLEEDLVQNAPLLVSLRRGTAELIAADEDGVLLWEREGAVHMLSARDEAAAERLLAKLDRCCVLCVCQSRLAKIPAEKFGLHIGKHCRQIVYLDQPMPLDNVLTFRGPTDRELTRIADAYELADLEEIADLRRRGTLFVGLLDGGMVGFVGRHQEGSVGLLQVFPEYRGRGYGQRLEAFMVNRVLAGGELPYGHVFLDNDISVRLQEKLGWTFARETICWMFPEAED